jgi:hypothetical protein
MWPLSIALQLASATALTAYTSFFLDDWVFLGQARRTQFSLHYLRLGLYEHFSPLSRLLDKLVSYSTGSFALAHSLQLLMYAAAIVAFAFVVRTILGNRWWAFALTILFGQSLFLIRLLNWWTATANILPATIFGLVAFGAYLRWQRERSRKWMAVSLVCFLVSLLDYETAILMPFYILAIRLLIQETELRPRAWIRALRSERSMWLSFLAIDGLAILNFFLWYQVRRPAPSLTHLAQFFVIAVFGTFIPALFGIKNPQSTLGHEPLVVIACVVVALAVVAYFVYTRPRAWRCVLVFLLIAVISMAPVGIARIVGWGVHIGKELYYQQSLQFMFLILVAFALRTERRHGPPAWLSAMLGRLRGRMTAAALLVAGVAAYGALFVTSVEAMSDQSWGPQHSKAYVRTFRASLRSTIERTGREPVLYNLVVPEYVSPTYNSYSIFFPLVVGRVRVNTVTSPMYIVGTHGSLIPVRFHRSVTGLLSHATFRRQRDRSQSPAIRHRAEVCTPADPHSVRLTVPLPRPLRLTAYYHPLALRLFLRMPARAPVVVTGQASGHHDLIDRLFFQPTFNRGLSGQYVPLLRMSNATAMINLWLPGGACVSSLAVGSFTRVAP